MHEKEIQYFTEAFKLAKDKFYIDAIHQFQSLIKEFPESDLADDALYNVGLCYYEMCQFEKAIEVLEKMIEEYPDATITALEQGNEFGKTAAKAYYLIVQCYIGLDNVDKADSYIPIIEKYNNTYIAQDDKKISFKTLAEIAINKFKELNK